MDRSRTIAPYKGLRRLIRNAVLAVPILLFSYLGACALLMLCYTQIMPPVTGVQLQRMVESRMAGEPHTRTYHPVHPDLIPAHVVHAAIAAEDGRFYEHRGVDWTAVGEAREEMLAGERMRGGSSITQQLVKNLFMTTHRSFIRKALEVPLAYMAEMILSKERIVVLYVNVIEWGPGIYGIEAAAQHHYRIPASQVTRYQAAALAACIPNPLQRTPARMGWYTDIILQRMQQHNW